MFFFHFYEFLDVAKLKKDASHRRFLICDQEAGFNKSLAHYQTAVQAVLMMNNKLKHLIDDQFL